MATGKIVQVQGPVVDVEFEPGQLPQIYNAVRIPRKESEAQGDLIVEVSQHLGNDVVRCVAMSSTDGLVRGTDAIDTGQAISVPVGPETLGRVFPRPRDTSSTCNTLTVAVSGLYTPFNNCASFHNVRRVTAARTHDGVKPRHPI